MIKSLLRLILLAGCVLLLMPEASAVLAQPNSDPISPELIERLETLIPKLMEEHQTPGVSVVLIKNRNIAWVKCFGVKAAGKPDLVTPDTLFESCSMSKPVFGMAVLKLVEQGKLDLDKPLASYLPEPYLKGHPLHEKITARMVLNHTSGLPNWRKGGWRSGSQLEMQFEPGSKYQYSGEGFLFLQRVVEHLTGEPLAPWIQQTLLLPLGMKQSSYVWQNGYENLVAAGHDSKGEIKTEGKRFARANGAYTLFTTPSEYAQFLLALMNAPASDGAQAVSPSDPPPFSLKGELLEEMLTPVVETGKPNQWRSLGMIVSKEDERTIVSHNGSNGTGFRCISQCEPATGSGLVIMTNSMQGQKLYEAVVTEFNKGK